MSTPVYRDAESESVPNSPNPLGPAAERRQTCQEELAGRARERTNAYGSTSPPVSNRERTGYASRELERLAQRLRAESTDLRDRGEARAADSLDRTARELFALAQAVAGGSGR